jgi:HEPN domain-containing protein/predicted nucleotidyltransferase
MIQATADARLTEIARTIVDRIAPRRIVVFGSRARGDARTTSDYDLMVEVDEGGDVHDLADRIDSAIEERNWSVDVIVRTPTTFVRMRDDPGYVDWDISREGRVLYEHEPLGPLFSGLLQVSEPEGGWRSVSNWIERSDEDFRTTELALNAANPPWSAIAQHAHDGVEKLLKALLVRRGVRPPRTHSLPKLRGSLPPDISRDAELRRACRIVQKPYPRSRYPGETDEPPPTEKEARDAAAAATLARSILLPLLLDRS